MPTSATYFIIDLLSNITVRNYIKIVYINIYYFSDNLLLNK